MKCPVCPDADLMMSDRQGVEIDYCPKCRGVWLDRGELDKIIERTAIQEAPAQAQPVQPQYDQPRYDQPRHEQPRDPRHYAQPGYNDSRHGKPYRSSGDHGYYKHKKKSSFLGELFDF